MKSIVIFLEIVAFAASMALIIPTQDSNSDESKSNSTLLQAIMGFTLRDPIEIAERLKNIPLETDAQIASSEVDAGEPDEVNDRLSDSEEVSEAPTSESQLSEQTNEAELANEDE